MSAMSKQEPLERLIELRPPEGVAAEHAALWASHFAAPGVSFDEEFEPVPMKEGTVMVRALVDSDDDAVALEGRPEVERVWRDAPIAPFAAEADAGYQEDDLDFDDDEYVEVVDPLAGDSLAESPSAPRLVESGDSFDYDDVDDDVDESNLGF